ncbi:hypothetical protein AHF37_04445 [Paragonimus kellicotti]|nr:hypothetical protein AHF37_04445 [Paragonimus kellicotti]
MSQRDISSAVAPLLSVIALVFRDSVDRRGCMLGTVSISNKLSGSLLVDWTETAVDCETVTQETDPPVSERVVSVMVGSDSERMTRILHFRLDLVELCERLPVNGLGSATVGLPDIFAVI